MTVTVASFLVDFPEFTPAPVNKINFWLNIAVGTVNQKVFGALSDAMVELVTAHYVSMNTRAAADPSQTGPGSSVGAIVSKSVGGAAASYDVPTAGYPGAGHWNNTFYGKAFYGFVLIFGAGGIQIG